MHIGRVRRSTVRASVRRNTTNKNVRNAGSPVVLTTSNLSSVPTVENPLNYASVRSVIRTRQRDTEVICVRSANRDTLAFETAPWPNEIKAFCCTETSTRVAFFRKHCI